MYCPNCGNQTIEGARYCNHCGAPIATAQPEPKQEPIAEPVVEQTPAPEPTPAVQPIPAPSEANHSSSPLGENERGLLRRQLRGNWTGRKVFGIISIVMWATTAFGLTYSLIFLCLLWVLGLIYLLILFVPPLIVAIIFSNKKKAKTREMFATARQLGVKEDIPSVKEYLERTSKAL